MRRLRSILAAATVIAVSLGGCADGPTPGEELRARIEQFDPPDRFRMAYRATGTDVLDCALPNRAFVLGVDPGEDLLQLEGPGPGPPVLAVRRGGRLSLHASLFALASVDTEWVVVDLDRLDEAGTQTLHRVLGVDLATYLLADGLPATGESIAAAALAVANDVEALNPIGAEIHAAYRILLDRSRYIEALAGSSTGRTEAPEPEAPVIEIELDGSMITDVSVRPSAPDDADAAGWTIAFRRVDEPFDLPAIEPATLLEQIDGDVAAPPIESCTLGDESPEDVP